MKQLLYSCLLLFLFSCNKQDAFLDRKSTKADVTPTTLADFQAIMDNDIVMNAAFPSLGIISADNYYVEYTAWQATTTTQEKNAYLWAQNIYNGEQGFDWQTLYQSVEYANIVLEGLEKIPTTQQNQSDKDALKGTALFFRAYAFYNLAQLFSAPYNTGSANTDLGIPLRLSSDVNQLSLRATVQQTYDQIISDLSTAVNILPLTPSFKTKPGQAAAIGLLARVYLNMGNFTQSLSYANKALTQYAVLQDYNTINTTATISFQTFQTGNPEVLFYANSNSFGILSYNNLKVDTNLYRSYAINDLRRAVFYKDNGATGIAYKGDYCGTVVSSKFSGIATNELFLIRAESNARLGNTAAALSDLNTLLQKRWRTGTFVGITSTTADDALSKILTERRKELPFTGILRWEDLRRLNQDPNYARSLKRVLNGIPYALDPGDKKWVLPIPDNEIRLSGIEQNPR